MNSARPTKHRGTRAQRLHRSHWVTPDEHHAAYMRRLHEKERLEALHDELFVHDHIYPIFGKTVSGLSVPGNMQVLSWAVNATKKNKMPDNFVHELWDPAGPDVFRAGVAQ